MGVQKKLYGATNVKVQRKQINLNSFKSADRPYSRAQNSLIRSPITKVKNDLKDEASKESERPIVNYDFDWIDDLSENPWLPDPWIKGIDDNYNTYQVAIDFNNNNIQENAFAAKEIENSNKKEVKGQKYQVKNEANNNPSTKHNDTSKKDIKKRGANDACELSRYKNKYSLVISFNENEEQRHSDSITRTSSAKSTESEHKEQRHQNDKEKTKKKITKKKAKREFKTDPIANNVSANLELDYIRYAIPSLFFVTFFMILLKFYLQW